MRELVEQQNQTQGFTVRLLAPAGISHVRTLSGRALPVPNNRIIFVSESDTRPLIAAGFTRLCWLNVTRWRVAKHYGRHIVSGRVRALGR